MDYHTNRWCLFGLISFCTLFGQNEGTTRTFFIGIREEAWDYAPGGYNLFTGKPVTQDDHASLFLLRGPHRIGHVYKKAMYRQYTDATYSKEILKPTWLGYLGPVIRAEVEDVIVIHLKNFASRRYSLHPHGVHYEKDSEGALYPDGTSGAKKQDDGVPPGGNYTYTWTVKPEFAPAQGDPNCLTWAYHSHVIAYHDISSGLIGALLTCKKGVLQPVSDVNYSQVSSGVTYSQVRRTDVDKDFLLLFSVVNENLSWYLDENIQKFCLDPASVDVSDPDFQLSNQMNAINGYVYGNLPGIDLCQNKKVSWHFIGMGNEVDIHTAYFHGQTLLVDGHRFDSVSLFPATFMTALMEPLTIGRWMLACQVNSHIQDGMQAMFSVSLCAGETDSVTALNGIVRKYFIAAELVRWNYAPSGIDSFTNASLTDSRRNSELYFGTGNGSLGGEYTKVVYRAYTDETFTENISTDAHLGILGPVLRAEVGDTLQVTFLNKADRNYSIQSHGLQYAKLSEGAQYDDDTEKKGSNVQPGDSFNYTWYVREGPSDSDQACISYLYFSSSDPIRDTNSGLFGPLLVCKRGALTPNNTQKDVDKEFFLLFTVMDENLSWYLKENIQIYGSNESDPENEGFQESNKMHAVNGYMYGNLPGLEVCEGDRVRWHLLGLGTEVDMHGVYFQGNTFHRNGITRDTLAVFPHSAVSVSMQPDTTGPIIKAEVGEVLQIIFLNKASRPYSIQPHGVKTSPQNPTPVLPGNMSMYQWIVPESSGPGVSDPNCITFAYYSTVDFIKDTVSGLIGPLVICRKGTLNQSRQRVDVDKEIALLFFIFDENKSWYLEQNIQTYYNSSKPLIRNDDFVESNKMHAINGKLYGNLQGVEMRQGERVNWYLLGMGSEVDLHTVHLHGQTFIYKTDLNHRDDVFDLIPGTFQTLELVADTEGTWLLHCHVDDHIRAGMETTYSIKSSGASAVNQHLGVVSILAFISALGLN
ncbi:hypothetical protein QTP70_027002 [Hemibagrus guttatus]|uniref:ferroxidase n=1 Tax=Hemibagrus guttatus TaxID=175788 RepID=A0AAE0QJQ3_9TELE|nr:hypothetical protein QTP70_027002 [Hemibagrus guttatus]